VKYTVDRPFALSTVPMLERIRQTVPSTVDLLSAPLIVSMAEREEDTVISMVDPPSALKTVLIIVER